MKCDNEMMMNVLTSGRARDLYLGACAHNIWFEAILAHADIQYVHILGKNNRIADFLSMLQSTQMNYIEKHVNNPMWVPAFLTLLQLNNRL